MSETTDPIEGYYAQQTATPTAREVLARFNWLDAKELAARVEAVLAEMPGRPEPPADLYTQGWWDALAHVERLLNGR